MGNPFVNESMRVVQQGTRHSKNLFSEPQREGAVSLDLHHDIRGCKVHQRLQRQESKEVSNS